MKIIPTISIRTYIERVNYDYRFAYEDMLKHYRKLVRNQRTKKINIFTAQTRQKRKVIFLKIKVIYL